METLQKLREHLSNISQEEFNKEWAKVEDVGQNGPTVSEFLNLLESAIYNSDSLEFTEIYNTSFDSEALDESFTQDLNYFMAA